MRTLGHQSGRVAIQGLAEREELAQVAILATQGQLEPQALVGTQGTAAAVVTPVSLGHPATQGLAGQVVTAASPARQGIPVFQVSRVIQDSADGRVTQDIQVRRAIAGSQG